MKTCPKCSAEHSKPGIYCSRKCANSREWSADDKAKKSDALKGRGGWSKGIVRGAMSEDTKDKIRSKHQQLSRERYDRGEVTERATLRRLIAEDNGYHCDKCGLDSWCGNPITLIVDHIDGNAGNNMPSNLRLICPNCNSQTDTFGGRNKGSGRKSRGLPTR